MADKVLADASPEKRLFISLLTRDIPLVAAFLDLVDNSINAALEPHAAELETAEGYLDVFQNEEFTPSTDVEIHFSDKQVSIRDTASGISLKVATEHVFKFGRGSGEQHESDRLSVYGIGLKRALFKLGNKITIRSDHVEGGFDMTLDVAKWARRVEQPWRIEITPRPSVSADRCGTRIVVTELYDEVKRRINDGVFSSQLMEAIARTYAYFIAKFVNISVNGKPVDGVNIEIGENHASEEFQFDGVTCAITAGIGTPEGGHFRDRSSGWFVFCNGRAVVSADKSSLTGWGGSSGLPLFQPKHRPFLGTVFFVSKNAELLPWTTTKSAINEDSALWQMAKRQMAAVGRLVISFLDGRYTDEGTEVGSRDLERAAGTRMSVLSAAVAQRRTFEPVKAPPTPPTTRIQYDALVAEIKAIARYLKKPSMSGSDVGRHTFNFFLRNEVGEK